MTLKRNRNSKVCTRLAVFIALGKCVSSNCALFRLVCVRLHGHFNVPHICIYIYIYIFIYISTVGVLVQPRSPFVLFSFVRSCVSARASGLVGTWESNAKSGYTLCFFALFLDHPHFFQQFLLCVSARRFRLCLVQSRRHRSDIELKLKWSQSEIEVIPKRILCEFGL